MVQSISELIERSSRDAKTFYGYKEEENVNDINNKLKSNYTRDSKPACKLANYYYNFRIVIFPLFQ